MIQDFTLEVFHSHEQFVSLEFNKDLLALLAGFVEIGITGPMKGQICLSQYLIEMRYKSREYDVFDKSLDHSQKICVCDMLVVYLRPPSA
jgi:hypothetical protein